MTLCRGESLLRFITSVLCKHPCSMKLLSCWDEKKDFYTYYQQWQMKASLFAGLYQR